MKKTLTLFIITLVFLACKEESKVSVSEIKEDSTEVIKEVTDSILVETNEIMGRLKSTKELKKELISKGFKIDEYVDKKTQDTILMQQYFMAFLKRGPIRGQNEEESAELQALHIAHLKKMYDLGYADISGPFGDDGNLRGITIYNVPTLKMADSLANSDPMVIAGRLNIEIHPWWAGKGFPLR